MPSNGAISSDGQVLASYVHGLIDHPAALSAVLAWAGIQEALTVDFNARREADIDRLADAVEAAFDWPRLGAALA